jgi:hypothetical protein
MRRFPHSFWIATQLDKDLLTALNTSPLSGLAPVRSWLKVIGHPAGHQTNGAVLAVEQSLLSVRALTYGSEQEMAKMARWMESITNALRLDPHH